VHFLVQVLALGMVFIGLTMTIIAHWPGSTSIGENPLKIAGPILLAVGGVLFIVGVILICCLNRRERRRWERMIMKFAASRPPYVSHIVIHCL
jgi:type VI protein secretion system component VasK